MYSTKHISYLILFNPGDSPERQILACLQFTDEKWYYCLTKDNQQVASSGFEFLTFSYSMLKIRDITLPTKVRLVKAMVFPVVMFGCESWAIQAAECQRTDAFELWCWRRLLRVVCTARRSNPSTLQEISPEYSLGGLMLMLKLQYFGHLTQRADSLEKNLMLGKTEGRRRGEQ